MKPICIIPARSGSKGLPDKNMLFLDGKPMIFHTIQAAIDSQLFALEDIVVSTDSPLYNGICQQLGVKTVLRRSELASDTATTFDLLEDFLSSYDDNQVFILLQATSPLRTGQEIKAAFSLFQESFCDNVVSVSSVDKSPALFSRLTDDGMLEDIVGVDKGYRRQNTSPLYYPNGAIYISIKGQYLTSRSFFTTKTKAFLMNKESSLDVDDKQDFIHCIGSLFFDYQRREQKNKIMYQESYQSKIVTSAKAIILGDSRLVDLDLDGYTNYALGGVTLATLLENIDSLLTPQVEEVLISIGINDFITKYSIETIKKGFISLLDILSERKVRLTTIPYALFRSEVNNQDVVEVNAFLMQLCQERHIPLLDLNTYLSEDGHLKYEHTNDGLHFKKETQTMLEKIYAQFVFADEEGNNHV